MPVNINDFKLYTEFLRNKAQAGNTLSISQFNQVCFQACMQKFEMDFQTFLATEEVSEFLKTYFKNIVVSVPLTGEISYPSDFQHLSSMRKYYAPPGKPGRYIQVDEVKNVAWGHIQMSPLQPPTLRFPKYSEFNNVIRLLPRDIGIIEMDYFRIPVQPIWGYSTASSRPVYSPATSTDFEFSEFSTNEIAGIFLNLIGINLKDETLLQWANEYKQSVKSVL